MTRGSLNGGNGDSGDGGDSAGNVGDPQWPADEEFPLGDGTADIEATVQCPYCWGLHQISLDPGSGPDQQYVEDCPTCCQPWRVRVVYRGGSADVEVRGEDAP